MNTLNKIWFLSYVLFLRLRHWKRVIVLERTGGLGDVICCISIYRALKQKYPKHLVVYATFKPFAGLLKHSREIDAIYGITPGTTIPKERATWLVDHHYEPHSSDELGLGGQKLHVINVFQKNCGLPMDNERPQISIPTELKKHAAKQFGFKPDETLIAIHTGRTWPVKELTQECWQEIIIGLNKLQPCRILHFCSPSRIKDKVLPSHKLEGVQTMPPDLTVLATAAVLSQCRLVIGIDSGLLHLGGALDVPILGVFGPTNPNYYLPFTSLAHGIWHEMPCSFCHHEIPNKHWHTGCPNDVQ